MPTDNQSPKYKSHPTSSYTVPKYNHILKRQVMKKNAVCLISKHSTMIKKYFYVKLYFSVCECTCYKTISVLIFLTCCRFINIIKKWHYIKRYALFNFYFNRYKTYEWFSLWYTHWISIILDWVMGITVGLFVFACFTFFDSSW